MTSLTPLQKKIAEVLIANFTESELTEMADVFDEAAWAAIWEYTGDNKD